MIFRIFYKNKNIQTLIKLTSDEVDIFFTPMISIYRCSTVDIEYLSNFLLQKIGTIVKRNLK